MRDDKSDEPGYLGAMFDEEQRLVLVPVDPERPWSAFRRMRKLMKRSRKSSPPRVTMFKAPPEEPKVIELPPRDAED